jgi:hypothetical protein
MTLDEMLRGGSTDPFGAGGLFDSPFGAPPAPAEDGGFENPFDAPGPGLDNPLDRPSGN